MASDKLPEPVENSIQAKKLEAGRDANIQQASGHIFNIYVQPHSRPDDMGNKKEDVSDKYQSVFSSADELIVSKTGAYQTISAAIRQAKAGSRIIVRNGIYHDSVVIDKKVEIVGEGEVVIESEAVCILMQTDYAEVRNLMLRGLARKDGAECFGVDVPQGKLVLEHCDIVSNSRSGVAIHGKDTQATLHNCKIHHSKRSGVAVYDNAFASLDHCDICGNIMAGVSIREGRGQLNNCDLSKNQCGIAIVRCDPVLYECKIHHNTVAGVVASVVASPDSILVRVGVALSWNSHGRFGRLEKCDIYENADRGVWIFGGNPDLRDCNIYGNKGNGVFVWNRGGTELHSCNLYGNKGNGVCVTGFGHGLIEKCKIFDNTGEGVKIQGPNSNRLIKDCTITNNHHGVVVDWGGGGGTVENCDLRDNRNGPHSISKFCRVHLQGNTE